MDRLKWLVLTGALVVVVVAVAAESASAAKGGNSANAHACQQDGWKLQVTQAGDLFADQAACVSYAAEGGTLLPPRFKGQAACVGVGGTFALGPDPFLWSCNRYPVPPNDIVPTPLAVACGFDENQNGFIVAFSNFDGTFNLTCQAF